MSFSVYVFPILQTVGFVLFLYLMWLAVKPLAVVLWHERYEEFDNEKDDYKQMLGMIRWKTFIVALIVGMFAISNPFTSFHQGDTVDRQRMERQSFERSLRTDREDVPIIVDQPTKDEIRIRENRVEREMSLQDRIKRIEQIREQEMKENQTN